MVPYVILQYKSIMCVHAPQAHRTTWIFMQIVTLGGTLSCEHTHRRKALPCAQATLRVSLTPRRPQLAVRQLSRLARPFQPGRSPHWRGGRRGADRRGTAGDRVFSSFFRFAIWESSSFHPGNAFRIDETAETVKSIDLVRSPI